MTSPRAAFSPAAVVAAGLALGGVLAFAGPLGAGAFPACLLCLVLAAAAGPFTFSAPAGSPRWGPAARAALRCLALGAGAALVCGLLGGAAGIAAGLFCGLYAFAAGAVAHLCGGGPARLLAAAAALALLATLFFWDDAFLLRADDRKASAALAFRVNPAAAASLTLGVDWIHAKALYTGNETAESLVGVRLQGLGPYSLRLGAVALACAALGLWRRP